MLGQIGLLIAGFNLIIGHTSNVKIEVLTDNFFENLQGDPYLLVENDLSETSKQFIEKQIQNYVKLVTHGELGSIKKKRSLLEKLSKDAKGIYLLSGITPSVTIPARFPVDLTLFYQNSQWYAAALESSGVKDNSNSLVVFRYANKTFNEEARVSIENGVKLATINIGSSTFIAAAENDTSKDSLYEKSGIYQFDASGLVKIQTIDMFYASDIVMWKIHNEIYMSIAQFMSNKTGNIHYEVKMPVYKWLGKHFDIVQFIEVKGARKITPFTVDHLHFLAVANFRNDKGNTKIYSEIYKYNYHLEKYELHQRILTRACNDIKFFIVSQNNRKKDGFLIVANSYDEDSDGQVNYETDSILYKFVDNYFIPFQSFQLNAVEEWLPVEGPNKEFVLFASCRFEGLRSFQYDGWAFTEIPQKTNEMLRGMGISAIRSTDFNETPTIVVANKNNNGNVANLFKLEFTHHNTLNEIYDEMIEWCETGLEKIEELNSGEGFEIILGKAERADIDEAQPDNSTPSEIDDVNDEIEEIKSKIDSLSLVLDQAQIEDTSQINTPQEIDYDITADEVTFNGAIFIHNLNTAKINEFQTNELLENHLNVRQGFELDEVKFSHMKIEGSLIPKTINGRNSTTLMHCTDNLNLDKLTVRGSLIASKGMEIKGKLNGMSVDDHNLILNVGDQNLSKPMNLNSIKIDRMTAKSLNGKKLATVQVWQGEPINVDRIENLKVKNINIGGYINDVDVPTLEKYALRKSGDQEITSDYIFDALEGLNLEVEGKISGRKLSDLIPTDGGNYSINQDMIFKNNLTINNLNISNSLNGIDVDGGKLDVLLKDHPEEQQISDEKTFDDVLIHNPINIRGKIKGKAFEKMNPVIVIEDVLVLEGNRTITGDVQIEDFVVTDDIVTPDGIYSLTKLETDGLRLTEKEIQPHLHFIQQLNVDEIFVDTINGREPTSFVVNGDAETQIVQGWKIFEGDLNITGPTNVFKINEVIVGQLENTVMKVEGNQSVVGKHHIKHVIVDKITSNNIKFGTNTWSDIITADTNQTISGTIIINGDLKTKTINTKKMTVKGLVNGFKFGEIVDDTVTKNNTSVIGGSKFFENLTIDILDVQNGVEMAAIDRILENNELRLKGALNITKPVKVENIYFERECNGVDKNSFGKDDVDEDGGQFVDGDHVFDTIVVYGKTYIDSNRINNVEIRELAENTVKLDEPFEFKTATFASDVISKSPVLLHGHLENVDFDNVLLSGLDSEQNIFDENSFESNLTINGSVHFGGFINGINITQFCDFAMGKLDSKNLTVDGDAFFVRGPNVGRINDISVKDVWDNAWFNDKDTTLTGYVEFENVIFENDIDVVGFVDNVSLKLLSENYFSKSKDQSITATLNFENDLIFHNNISVPEIILNGAVNGITLDEFIRTALLDDYDQVFETVLYLENCAIKNLTGDFAVNGLNLQHDVMRYDKINMVTGTKFFANLNVNLLKVEKNIKIQDVDVLDWFRNSVLKTTAFNITGTKSFKNAFFANGFELMGSLNNQKFDEENLMLKNIPQDITGKKTIFTNVLDPVRFRAIKLRGLLNDIDVTDLINNQAYKNTDNTFTTDLYFHNNITTNNLVIEKSYQDINMSELITNVTNLGALNNLLEQYTRLLTMSYKLEKSIAAQAYFMHHYKIIQTIPLTRSMKIVCPDGVTRIGTLAITDDSSTKIDLYGWHDQKEQFSYDANHINYIDQVLMGRYLYIEEDSGGTAHFFNVEKSFNNVKTIPSNKTKSTTSFVAPSTNQVCTLFIYHDCAPRIYCEKEKNIRLMQVLETSKAFKATSVTIKDTLYLIIINEPTNGMMAHIEIWKLNNETNSFQIHQSVFEAKPKSIATVRYNEFFYLAIASGHLQNAMYSGRVELRRFDEQTQQFVQWQSLELDAPIQVEFSILPSNELVLYILTDNPTEPLLVFRYEGIAGFQQSVVGSTLPKILYINQFIGGVNQHFIVAQSNDEIYVIQAIFKGEKIAGG